MPRRPSVDALLAFSLLLSAPAGAIPIDLNDFYADPTVAVAADGSSALLTEDAALASVILSNDPGLGDPTLIAPGFNVFLTFDYVFTEAVDGVDEFFALLFDADTRETLSSWFCAASCAGTAVTDLSAFAASTLGLEFQLSSIPPDDANLDSTVRIANLDVERRVVAVAEPSTLALLAAGGFLAFGWRRRRAKV
jgi:hypothetical protein